MSGESKLPSSRAQLDAVIWGGMQFLPIPAGQFWMGSDAQDPLAWSDEVPRHLVDLAYLYWVARFPVQKDLFAGFCADTAYGTTAEKQGWAFVWQGADRGWEKVPDATWQTPLGPEYGLDIDKSGEHPVVQVSWYDALAFCAWCNAYFSHGLPEGTCYRLPNEAEWEKAARGVDGLAWPWGATFDAARCNSAEGGPGRTQPSAVASPGGDSHYGVADMAGNVWEWTTTLWGEDKAQAAFRYPYSSTDGRENLIADSSVYRIIRGGSYKDDRKAVRCACRDLDPPNFALSNLGFRMIVAPGKESHLHEAGAPAFGHAEL